MTGDHVIYLQHEGVQRRYVVHLPCGPNAERCAVVMMLEGRGGTPWTGMKSTGWSQKSDAEGFMVVYPEALRLNPAGPQHFLDNPQMWHAGGGSSDVDRPEVDDVGFLRSVIADVCERFAADLSRIFVTGFSNGAAMTYRLAAALPALVRAIAPVAGYCRLGAATLDRPVPTIAMCGMRDPLNPYSGGMVDLPWGKTEWRPPMRESVLRWVTVNGLLAAQTEVREEADYVLERFHGATPDAEILLYAVRELGHVWPGGHRLLPEALVGKSCEAVKATNVVWDFFRRHGKA